MAEPSDGNDNYDLKLKKDTDTFRAFTRVIERQGYPTLKAGILAALNFYVQHFSQKDNQGQPVSSPG
jgi:hypothetical protein